MRREEIILKLKYLKPLLKKSGFNIIGIFGSVARDENNKNSDIDIVYSIEPIFLKKFGGFSAFDELKNIKKILSKELNSKIDIITIDSNNKTLQKNLQKELVYV